MRAMIVLSALTGMMLAISPVPAKAQNSWTTGCDFGNGTFTRFSPFRAAPRGGGCNRGKQQRLSILTEVPGIQFGKRRKELDAPGEVRLIEFRPFAVWLVFEANSEEGEGASCSMILEVEPAASPISIPSVWGSTPTENPMSMVIAGPGDDIAGLRLPLEFIASSGEAFRTQDLKIILDADGCFGAGTFRMGKNARAFYVK